MTICRNDFIPFLAADGADPVVVAFRLAGRKDVGFFGVSDPNVLNGLQLDLDGEAEFIRMELAVGVFADPVDVSRSLAAGIDIAEVGLIIARIGFSELS